MTTSVRQMAVKVPAVTAFFWIIKILATTVGETFADFLNGSIAGTFNLTDAQGLQAISAVMGTALVLVLVAQMRAKSYIPWLLSLIHI